MAVVLLLSVVVNRLSAKEAAMPYCKKCVAEVGKEDGGGGGGGGGSYCAMCGATISADAKVCPACGAAQPEPAAAQMPVHAREEARRDIARYIPLYEALGILLVLGLLAAWWIGRMG